MTSQGDITRLLVGARSGEQAMMDRLFTCVYDELRVTAHRLTSRESGDTLNTTALVHEAYLKLVGGSPLAIQDRRHFFSIAARAMRQILVDTARRRRARKRGGDLARVSVDAEHLPERLTVGRIDGPVDAVALDEALTALETADARLARVVELRFFVGLSLDETGDVLGVSSRTVKRDWQKAKAFLYSALSGVPA